MISSIFAFKPIHLGKLGSPGKIEFEIHNSLYKSEVGPAAPTISEIFNKKIKPVLFKCKFSLWIF